jgi:GNAT superfamily N-acetyltransferase
MSDTITRAVDVFIQNEVFPPPLPYARFAALFRSHGIEVRGKPFELDYRRYFQLESDGRLIFIVGRDKNLESQPIGYSCHFWYRDLHFNERICCDDLWFVMPEYRGRGIGRALKVKGHSMMAAMGAIEAKDTIRGAFAHTNLMDAIGFKVKALQWTRDLKK